MLVYFMIRNQNNNVVPIKLFEKNRSMNNGIGIKSIHCFVQVQFGLKQSRNWLFLM